MKKGFTLIELLAVIVILAVVAVIAVPIILNVIESAKKGAIKDSAYGIIESANVYVASNLKDGLKTSLKFTCEKNKCVSGDKEITFKGKIEQGTLIINSDSKVLVCVDDGEYYALKNVDSEKVTNGNGTCGEYEEENGTFAVINATSETIKAYEAKIAELEDKIKRFETILISEDGEAYITWPFEAKNNYQTFTVPVDGIYTIELWGSHGKNASSNIGGNGGYTKGQIELKRGDVLYLYIGNEDGWNGGGGASSQAGTTGGGATDVRTIATSNKNIWQENESLRSRIMVAAGGGGGYNRAGFAVNGGAGGGLTGGNSILGYSGGSIGYGATQTAGGTGNVSGGFGYGASAAYYASGGGGGWFGGGVGYNEQAGAGGSSYISGHNGCVGIKADGTLNASSATKIEDSYSHTGYIFTETAITAGVNSGNGYAKISFTNLIIEE